MTTHALRFAALALVVTTLAGYAAAAPLDALESETGMSAPAPAREAEAAVLAVAPPVHAETMFGEAHAEDSAEPAEPAEPSEPAEPAPSSSEPAADDSSGSSGVPLIDFASGTLRHVVRAASGDSVDGLADRVLATTRAAAAAAAPVLEPVPTASAAHVAPAAPAPAPAPSSGAPAAPAADEVPPEVAALVLATTAATALGWASGFWAAVAQHAKRGLALLGLAGFTRLEKDALFDHEGREKLYALVRERPGMSVNDLVRATDTGRTAVIYHLRVLERESLVVSRREGRRRLFFATGGGAVAPGESAALAALAHATARSIAESVVETPGVDQQGLCRRLNLQPSLAHWHVDRLEGAGLVTRIREGRHVKYYPGPMSGKVLGGAGGVGG